MNKNNIIGFILIAAVLIGFTYFSSQKQEDEKKPLMEEIRNQDLQNQQEITETAQQKTPDSVIANQPRLTVVDRFLGGTSDYATDSLRSSITTEQIISLENEKIKIDFTTKGGQMRSASLKGYNSYNIETHSHDSLPLPLFDKDAKFFLRLTNRSGYVVSTDELYFTPIVSADKGNQAVIMRHSFSSDQYVDFIYTLSEDDYMLKFDIAVVGMEGMLDRDAVDYFEMNWAQDLRRQEKNRDNEQRYSHLYYKYVGDDVLELSDSKNEQKEVNEAPIKWVAFKDQYFASVLIADNQFKVAQVDSRILTSEKYLKTFAARMYAPVEYSQANNTLKAGFRYYLGPLQFSHLQSYDDDVSNVNQQLELDRLVYLGWSLFRAVNKYFVIPVFNLLGSTGLSVGIIILLLTIIVKLIVSPLTFKSFMSSAKMRVLRPQIEELTAKYNKPEDAMEKQKATMGLYRQAGVNPMSGCIPMLAQMPLLFALFQFFPTAIELRGESFLWATDLSTYDAILEWGSKIPLLGTHISLFCILMTVTNVIYTKFNMQMTNTGQQQMPGMKWMMYLMPLVFFFVLNDYPSGLTYYYFLSLLITILLTIGFRYFVDEEKLLAKLEANKLKPKKKKSGFMARLEEAQRMQQQQMKAQNKKKR